MFRRTATLATIVVTLVLGLAAHGIAQADGLPVTLIMRDGTHVPFTMSWLNRAYEVPHGVYVGGGRSNFGDFMAHVGGTSAQIPLRQLARADLVTEGDRTIWRATLRDGRVFDGEVARSDPYFMIAGTDQFGAVATLYSFANNPEWQDFIGIVFDPDAVAPGEAAAQQPAARTDVDSVTLRNGDVLSGTILTGEFTVQASYGILSFTSEQLASIRIEDAAAKTDQFILKVGDRVSGVLQNASIEMTLTTGATITLEKGNIASITFATED